MKKLLYILLFSTLLLTGCEKNFARPAPASLFFMDGDATSSGIRPGDGKSAFIRAYRDYPIQVAYSDMESNYHSMPIRNIPYDDNISTMIASLFIDGTPVLEQTLCSENDIKPEQLHAFLSDPKYLRLHDVVYRYLNFSWENGLITDIESGELNYNESFDTPRLE